MPITRKILTAILVSAIAGPALSDTDTRKLVELTERMQHHMLANMRDHLVALNAILAAMAQGHLEQAAEVAESRLGMSSLDRHGARHMAGFMPKGMREAGNRMHRTASRFALMAQEGDAAQAYRALAKVIGACVACHAGYRIR